MGWGVAARDPPLESDDSLGGGSRKATETGVDKGDKGEHKVKQFLIILLYKFIFFIITLILAYNSYCLLLFILMIFTAIIVKFIVDKFFIIHLPIIEFFHALTDAIINSFLC